MGRQIVAEVGWGGMCHPTNLILSPFKSLYVSVENKFDFGRRATS